MVKAKLPIPEKAMLDCGAILGKRGSGKSSLARFLLEHEVDVGHRCCFIDPMGDAAGIRLTPGMRPSRFQKVIIFGGASGDIPITEEDGAKVAHIIATHDISCIVDLSGMIQAEQLRFMAAFADVLFDHIKIPLTLFIDEAHVFAPQERGEASAKLLNRMARLNSQGRKRGIFLWLMTQRPARINKNILGGTETFIAMKVMMPQDLSAIADWFDANGPDAAREVRGQLPKLKVGEAFVFASGVDFFERVQFPMHSTLDTGRTPLHGETVGGVKLPKVDVTDLAKAFGQIATGDPRDDEIKALKDELTGVKARLSDERREHRTTRDRLEAVSIREERTIGILVELQMRIGSAIGSPRIDALPITAPYEQFMMVEAPDGVVRPIPRAGANKALVPPARRRMAEAKLPAIAKGAK
jgi:hypothetical protein